MSGLTLSFTANWYGLREQNAVYIKLQVNEVELVNYDVLGANGDQAQGICR